MTWRAALARKEVLACLSALGLLQDPRLGAPSFAKTSRFKENPWKTLVTQSTPEGVRGGNQAGEGAWVALFKSGLPSVGQSCPEKPQAGRCGKWLFWLRGGIAQCFGLNCFS